ncbi:MAG: hypothetical protein GX326_01315 [Clostridiaceae bacterium]|nr:hypothetical protein [Clostridiaceae bacterium]
MTSILMIIGGGLAIISAIIAIMGISALAALFESTEGLGMFYVAGGTLLVAAIIQLIAGIKGIGASGKKPEKAASCVIWGGIIIALTVVGNVVSIMAGSELQIISIILSLALPILYIIGALQLKNSYNATNGAM